MNIQMNVTELIGKWFEEKGFHLTAHDDWNYHRAIKNDIHAMIHYNKLSGHIFIIFHDKRNPTVTKAVQTLQSPIAAPDLFDKIEKILENLWNIEKP